MPRPDRDIQVLAKPLKSSELIVDQCLEGTDIDDQTARWLVQQVGKRGEEGGFGLAGGCARGHDDIAVGRQNERDSHFLDIAQRLPLLTPQIVLYPGGK